MLTAVMAIASQNERITPVDKFYIEWSNGEGTNIIIDNIESSKRGDTLEIAYSEYKTPEEYYILFANGSCIYVNEEEKIYSFTPAELGVWDYQVNDLQELQKLVLTYKSIYETGYY